MQFHKGVGTFGDKGAGTFMIFMLVSRERQYLRKDMGVMWCYGNILTILTSRFFHQKKLKSKSEIGRLRSFGAGVSGSRKQSPDSHSLCGWLFAIDCQREIG